MSVTTPLTLILSTQTTFIQTKTGTTGTMAGVDGVDGVGTTATTGDTGIIGDKLNEILIKNP